MQKKHDGSANELYPKLFFPSRLWLGLPYFTTVDAKLIKRTAAGAAALDLLSLGLLQVHVTSGDGGGDAPDGG